VKTKPPAVPIQGGVVPAPDSTLAPTLRLYGPNVLTVTPRSRRVTLVLFASDTGRVAVSIAGVALGTHDVRAGYNRLRVTVPQAQLRRAAGTRIRPGRLQLLVTALSPSNGRGMTVRRTVRVKR
jgi:hypothetical protein